MKRVWTGATFAMALGCAVSMSAQAGSTTGSQTSTGSRAITVTGCLSGGGASGTTGATGTSGTAGSTASGSRMIIAVTPQIQNALLCRSEIRADGGDSGTSDLAFTRRARNTVGSPVGERRDRTSGLLTRTGDEAAAIHQKQIRHIVRSVVLVHHRRSRIIAHSA